MLNPEQLGDAACLISSPAPEELAPRPGCFTLESMEERSEEQVISRLFDLENEGQSAQRAELTGERFISLIQDPDSGFGYVLVHGLDATEGAEVPEGTEFYEYPNLEEAQRAYSQLLDEDRKAGEVVETDSDEGSGPPKPRVRKFAIDTQQAMRTC